MSDKIKEFVDPFHSGDKGPYSIMEERINFLSSKYHILFEGDTIKDSIMWVSRKDAAESVVRGMNMAYTAGHRLGVSRMRQFMDETRPIIEAIKNAEKKAKERGWEKTYWLIDIHETIIKPDWKKGGKTEFYPGAIEALKLLSERKDVVLILWTSSWPDEIERYRILFASCGINFNYVNENPEVVSEAYGYYEDKPYFNVIWDDKSGFCPEIDLPLIFKYLEENEKQTV